jgi:hypothetical protein
VSAPASSVLKTLSAGGTRATGLADAITALVKNGSDLGALEDVLLRLPDGTTKTIRIFPRIWLERLQRAVNLGAFEKLTVDQIVDRVLLPPPSEAES